MPEPTNESLVSAPGSISVNGKTFLVDKHTRATAFSVYEWGSERARKLYNPFMEVAQALKELESAGLSVSEGQKSELLMQAHRVKVSGEVPGDDITRVMRSKEGVAFQLWVLTRKQHPEQTYEGCLGLITDDNRLDVYVDLDIASGANVINKAMIDAGFIQPDLEPAHIGSSSTVEVPSIASST
jgi:hypothetical protein